MKYLGVGEVQTVFGNARVPLPKNNPFEGLNETKGIIKFVSRGEIIEVFDDNYASFYKVKTKNGDEGYLLKCLVKLNSKNKNELYLCSFACDCSKSKGCILNGGECKLTTNRGHALFKDKSIINYDAIDPKPEHGKLYQVIIQNEHGEINEFPVFAEYLDKAWYYYDPMSAHSKEILTDFGCKVLHWKAVNTDF